MVTKRKKHTTKRTTIRVVFRYSIIIFLFAILGFGCYQYRLAISYYLGFQSKKNKETEQVFAAARIAEIVAKHPKQLFGLDVSEYQENIQWSKINSDTTSSLKLRFIFIRATAGNNKVDTQFYHNWQKAEKNGFIKGAYHYYRPNENSLDQAKLFCKTVQLKKGDLPPVLDIEQLPEVQSVEKLKMGLQKWLDYVENYYGVKPIVYSGEKYYEDFLQNDFESYKFWIANYNFWRKSYDEKWLFWQFSDKASISGISGNVDINVFNGNLEQLQNYTISK